MLVGASGDTAGLTVEAPALPGKVRTVGREHLIAPGAEGRMRISKDSLELRRPEIGDEDTALIVVKRVGKSPTHYRRRGEPTSRFLYKEQWVCLGEGDEVYVRYATLENDAIDTTTATKFTVEPLRNTASESGEAGGAVSGAGGLHSGRPDPAAAACAPAKKRRLDTSPSAPSAAGAATSSSCASSTAAASAVPRKVPAAESRHERGAIPPPAAEPTAADACAEAGVEAADDECAGAAD